MTFFLFHLISKGHLSLFFRKFTQLIQSFTLSEHKIHTTFILFTHRYEYSANGIKIVGV